MKVVGRWVGGLCDYRVSSKSLTKRLQKYKMSNLRNAGRQSLIITLNFDRVDDKVNEILNFCSNEKAKEKIISFCNDVMRELMKNETCQTNSITVSQSFGPWQTLSMLQPTLCMVQPTFCMVLSSFCAVWPAF